MTSEKIEYEIKPSQKFTWGIKELWGYKELIYFFIWRDVKIKYKQTLLGVLWVVLQPLLLLCVFSLVLGSRLKSSIGNIEYPVFFMSGILIWNFFSTGVTSAGNSIVSNSSIIKKIYFPRLIIPVSSVLGSFIDFIIGLTLYFSILVFTNPEINYFNLIYLPVSCILIISASFGIGVTVCSLTIKYRDFRYLMPFIVQFMMFVSPVIYTLKFDSNFLNYLISVNPIYAPIELFRAHLNGYEINHSLITISVVSNLFICVFGLIIFRKTERYFADLA